MFFTRVNFVCWLLFCVCFTPVLPQVPAGSPSRGGDVMVYVWHKPSELVRSFLFCYCVYFCLYGTFINSSDNSPFYDSVLLVLSLLYWPFQLYLFMKVSFSPAIIRSGWPGSKRQLTITAMARKRPWSFCPKCRLQVTPKHAYAHDPTTSEWVCYAAVQA